MINKSVEVNKRRGEGEFDGKLAAAGSPSPCRLVQAAERRSTAGWWEAVEPNGEKLLTHFSVHQHFEAVSASGFLTSEELLIAEVSSVK